MSFKKIVMLAVCLCISQAAMAQDTVRVSMQEFIDRGLKNSGQIEAAQQNVSLAENQVNQVQDQRYIPSFTLRTMHGLVPKAETDPEVADTFLDDLSNLSVSTEANLELIQPVYTWGALRNAVEAARSGAEAAQNQFQMQKNEIELRLYELYQSYLLSMEVERLLDQAQNQIYRVESTLEDSTGEASDIDQSDLFKFRVFKKEFAARAAEVQQNSEYVQRVWNYVLKADEQTVYMPEERFLDPVQNEIQTFSYYKNRAVSERPEIRALEAGIDAAEHGLKATKSQRYPALFVGLSGTYLNTPNPPLGNYTFQLNDNNFATGGIGIGFRQNLDFFGQRYDVQKSRIQQRKAQFSKQAATDGIVLQINENYKNASTTKIKIEKTDEALTTTKQWVRQEQLDYDFDMGDPKDLIDAIKKELELELQYKQLIFNFNKDMAELFKSAALPVTSLDTNY